MISSHLILKLSNKGKDKCIGQWLILEITSYLDLNVFGLCKLHCEDLYIVHMYLDILDIADKETIINVKTLPKGSSFE